MVVVLDTNILVSALISPAGKLASIYDAWRHKRFTLVTCEELLEELKATLEKLNVAELIKPHKAGRLVNQIRRLAVEIEALPKVRRSPDPNGDFLLALAEAAAADYLVTGDKSGLLALRQHKTAQIVSPTGFASLIS